MASLTVQDVTVTLQSADLQTALDAACEVTPADCATGTQAIGNLPPNVSVPVLLSVIAASAETSLQAALDAFCPV